MRALRFLRSLSRALGVAAGLASAGVVAAQDCPPPAPALTPALVQQAQRNAADRGFLWRAEKDGRVSWLYGTIHIGRGDWMVPGPRMAAALAASDVIALELDIFDPAFAAAVSRPADPAIAARVLTGDLSARLEAQAARSCAPAPLLAPMRPFMRAVTLSMIEMRRDGLHPEFALEGLLAAASRRLGKPLVGLETAAQQLEALSPRTDAEEREFVDGMLKDMASGDSRRHFRRLAQAWADGNEADLAGYEEWCHCVTTPAERAMLRRLLDERNPGLAQGIARLHAEGKSVFAGIGALHFVGRNSIVTLLREKGFTVTRVTANP